MLNFVAVAVTLIAGLIPGPQDGNLAAGDLYGSEALYGNAPTSKIAKAPKGYSLFFVQTVGRHGARAATTSGEEDRMIDLWEKANKVGALTDNGKGLKADIERFQAAEKEVGYGDLTRLGRAELEGIGRRTADNYANFFSEVQKDGDKIAFVSSPVERTQESADAMKSGIKKQFPKLNFAKDAVSKRTLIIKGNPSALGQSHIRRLKKVLNTKLAAQNVLANIFQPQFLSTIKNPVDAGIDMYRIYQRAPSLMAETDVTFSQYVDEADAVLLSREQTGEKFYRYGAGIRREDNSYRGAKPLLDDFMKRLQERVDGGKTAAVFRHGHGETVMPFTALTQLRSANQQEPKGGLYFDETNPFRGYKSGLLAGSIEWAAYKNEDGKVLLTLRFNEEPSRFSKACTPLGSNPDFYRLEEIKSCIRSTGGFV